VDGEPPSLSLGWLSSAEGIFAVLSLLISAALFAVLWQSRHLPRVDDIGSLLAHRNVGDYQLSMSHLFDLTSASFAALRLPAILAAFTLLIGPLAAWLLRVKGRHFGATLTLAATGALFLIAAHIAFARFEPLLSSKKIADVMLARARPEARIIVYGDQSDASSVIFYTHHFFGKPAELIGTRCSPHGEGSSLLWGSCYPDAPDVFLSEDELQREWGTGERKWLFAQDKNQIKAGQLLDGKLYEVTTAADKVLWTDRPLDGAQNPALGKAAGTEQQR
jgi:hypothetical protein